MLENHKGIIPQNGSGPLILRIVPIVCPPLGRPEQTRTFRVNPSESNGQVAGKLGGALSLAQVLGPSLDDISCIAQCPFAIPVNWVERKAYRTKNIGQHYVQRQK
jgi:hypothetical protein